MNKADWGAVPQFRFQEILKKFTLVGTCIVMNKAHTSNLVSGLLFSCFLHFLFL